MAPNLQTFPNPISLHTQKAMCIIGKLVGRWAENPDSIPAGARIEADGRLIVIEAAAFMKFLAGLPDGDALSDNDISLRDGITEVELVLRRPGRASLLLPEPEAVAFQKDLRASSHRINIEMPKFYFEIDSAEAEGGSAQVLPRLDNAERPMYVVSVLQPDDESDDPMDTFLHPHMGAYLCTQCT